MGKPVLEKVDELFDRMPHAVEYCFANTTLWEMSKIIQQTPGMIAVVGSMENYCFQGFIRPDNLMVVMNNCPEAKDFTAINFIDPQSTLFTTEPGELVSSVIPKMKEYCTPILAVLDEKNELVGTITLSQIAEQYLKDDNITGWREVLKALARMGHLF